MSPRFRTTAALFSALALFACDDDPTDPCSGGVECGLQGLNIALSVAEIEWSGDQPIDDRVGGRLVQPGDELTYRYRLVNTGDVETPPLILYAGTWVRQGNLGDYDPDHIGRIEVPALEPGEAFDGRVIVRAPDWTWTPTTDVISGWIEVETEYGAPLGRREFRYHLAVAQVRVTMQAQFDSLRVGEIDSVWVSVSNVSAVAALSGDFVIGFCALTSLPGHDSGCWGPGSSVHAIPDLEPGHSWSSGLEVMLPPHALPLEEPTPIGLRACVQMVDASLPIEERYYLGGGACDDQPTELIQDLDLACTPAVVELPATLDASSEESDCALDGFRTYDVWAFDVDAPRLHTLNVVAGDLAHARLFGPNHQPIAMSALGEFYVPAAGRHFVVVLPATPSHVFALE